MKMIVTHMATITTQMPKPVSTTNDEKLVSNQDKTDVKTVSLNHTKVISDPTDQILMSDPNTDAKKQIKVIRRSLDMIGEYLPTHRDLDHLETLLSNFTS